MSSLKIFRRMIFSELIIARLIRYKSRLRILLKLIARGRAGEKFITREMYERARCLFVIVRKTVKGTKKCVYYITRARSKVYVRTYSYAGDSHKKNVHYLLRAFSERIASIFDNVLMFNHKVYYIHIYIYIYFRCDSLPKCIISAFSRLFQLYPVYDTYKYSLY